MPLTDAEVELMRRRIENADGSLSDHSVRDLAVDAVPRLAARIAADAAEIESLRVAIGRTNDGCLALVSKCETQEAEIERLNQFVSNFASQRNP